MVARNALYLGVGQVVTAALSFGVTALLARHLGAEDYGIFYLAGAFVLSAFILVEFGQDYYVVRAVARSRERAGELLGTGLALRVIGALVIYLPVIGAARLLEYPETTRTAISLMVVFHFLSSLGNGFSTIFRGVERMDYEAASRVAFKTLIAAATVVAITLGARLVAVIQAQIVAAAGGLAIYVLILRRLAVPRPQIRVQSAGAILRGGAPFLLLGVLITLHESVDAIMLSKLAPGDAVGWYGAATRFTGILIFPATILGVALYPTLSRLFADRPQGYREFARSGLRFMLLLGALTAAGTYLFAEEAVSLVYGQEAFGPAATNLRVLTPYIFLVFVNIVLGTAIMAANRQARWAYAKGACVLLAIALNAVLIPFCQSRFGNGGIGSSAATSCTELVMLGAAFRLTPRGTLALELLRDLGRAIAATAAMAGVIWLLGEVSPGIGITTALLTFVAVVVLLGGVGREDLGLLRDAVRLRSGGVATEGS
ncbi:MAG: flippase [Nitrospinota bacterium]